MGRDSHLFKEMLEVATPVQILLGIYHYEHNGTASVPIMCRHRDEWLELDEFDAEARLAVMITKKKPAAYFTYFELREEPGAWAAEESQKAKAELATWIDGILG